MVTPLMDRTLIFERGDRVYLVGPVSPFTPAEADLQELAFADALLKQAPNKNLMWLHGNYVEAERPNANGALWSSDELAIASLTPMLMPVTVMHDPRTAVGLIADAKLRTPERDGVPRSRIETTLGLWQHRFPDVCEEVGHNYKAGALMQSMECFSPYYDCTSCGQRYPKLPKGAERANWCPCLRGEENAKAARRLGNVTFTGTGLIFGSRGARGAYDEAHLEVFQEEVAEFHERAHRDKTHKPRSKRHMEIEDREYQQLLAAQSERDQLKAKLPELEESAAKIPELETKVEQAEGRATKAESERDELKTKVEQSEEKARKDELAKERLDKLGKGFTEKLGDFTRGRLGEQAGSLPDDEWENRLKELEELAGVKRDDGAESDEGGAGGETVSREETARSHAGRSNNGGNGQEPSDAARRSVVAGLMSSKK